MLFFGNKTNIVYASFIAVQKVCILSIFTKNGLI